MNIVFLGWGSLIRDSRDLPHFEPWKNDGPDLFIEFSRISSDSRLSLVIDNVNGTICKTFVALSPHTNLSDAVEDLRKRERTSKKNIGFYNNIQQISSHNMYPDQIDISNTLGIWCTTHKVDGVVWTALPSNFEEEFNHPFSTGAAIFFLQGLAASPLANALRYIRNAPEEVDTPVRQRVNQEWPI